jgi:hypothetical protein
MGAESDEALQLLHGAAVHTLGLRLIAHEERPGVGQFCDLVETKGEGVVAILLAGDLDIVGQFFGGENQRLIIVG